MTIQTLIDSLTARLPRTWSPGMPPRSTLPATSAACPEVRILHCWRREGMSADILLVESTPAGATRPQVALVTFDWESGEVRNRSASGSLSAAHASGLSASSVHYVARWQSVSTLGNNLSSRAA